MLTLFILPFVAAIIVMFNTNKKETGYDENFNPLN